MAQYGVDVDQANALAAVLSRWAVDVEPIIDLVGQAELLADVPSHASDQLLQIGADGRRMASAIGSAVAMLTGFRIEIATAFESLVLDIPVGSHFDRATANEALAAGETYRQAQIRREVAALQNRPGGALSPGVAALLAEYRAIDPAQRGDLGGTLSVEIRDPYLSAAESELNQGIATVSHALADTADDSQIQVDEFQAILHDNGKVTLVLPGVIDLSKPHLGYDPETDSTRDTDQEAFGSLTTTDLADNGYARLIRDFFREQVANGAIRRGADVLIVGHSFGGDTALDLASDPVFNGELVSVTHVVSAAYHNEPQLDHVQPGTEVAVLQNIYDVPVIVEEIGYDLLTPSLADLIRVPNEGTLRLAVEGGEEIVGAGAYAVNGGAWVLEQGANVVTGFFGSSPIDIPEVPTDIEFIEDQVTITANGFVAEFEGGFHGVGHHQGHYINYVLDADIADPVTDFLAEIGEAGFGDAGITIAVDISRPRLVEPLAAGPNPQPARTPTPTPTPTPEPLDAEPAAAPTPVAVPEPIAPSPIPPLPSTEPPMPIMPIAPMASSEEPPSDPLPHPVPGPGLPN